MTQDKHAPILITGGTGFAGSHLTEALQALGYDNLHLTTFSPPPTQSTSGAKSDADNISSQVGLTLHQVDLTQKEQVEKLLQKVQPTQVYHLASFAAVGNSFDQAEHILKNNSLLQLHLLEAVKKYTPLAKVLVVGSAEEYGLVELDDTQTVDEQFPFNPVNPYAVSKITQDMLALAYQLSFKLNIVRVRPFNHIGERQTPNFAVPAFAKQIVAIERGQQKTLEVGNLAAIRDFTDVKDMVEAYITVMDKGVSGEVYNIGSGHGHSVQEVLDLLCSFSTTTISVVSDPSKFRPLDLPRIVANNSKVRSLGWEPKILLPITLERVLQYWRSL